MELKFEESATSAGKNCINSNQIKSATDNNGEFSNENDSILYSLADDKQWQTMDANDTAHVASAYASMEKTGKDGFTVHVNKNARVNDIVHELMHITRQLASPERLAGFVKAYGNEDLWLEDIKSNGDGTYTFNGQTYSAYADAENAARVNEEKFVQDFMQYLRDGSAPNTEIATFFGQLKDFFRRFVEQFRDNLSEDTVRAFDMLLNGEVDIQPGQTLEEAVEDSERTLTDDVEETTQETVVGQLREGLLGKKMGDLSPEIQNRILRTLPKAKISILQNDSGQTIVLAGNSEAMDVALEFVKRDTIYNKTTGNAGVITRTTQDKIASDKALYKTRGNGFEDYCQFTAGANLKYLYENAELTEDRDDRNNDPTIERVRIYSVAVDFGEGDIGVVEILAKKIKGIDRLYTLEVNQIRKATPKVWDKVISLVPAGSSSDGSKATPQSNSNVSSGTSSVKVNKLYSLSPDAQRQYDDVVAKYKGTD